VLEYYSDCAVLEKPMMKAAVPIMPPNSITYLVGEYPAFDPLKTFSEATARNACLIVVNPEEVHPAMFDAGVVTLPDSMIRDFVCDYAPEDADQYALQAALRGLSLKEMVEVSKLAMAASGEFTADAILRVRRERTVLSSGLQLVDTEQAFYEPQQELIHWLDIDGRLLKADVPLVVRPRGLLFSGDPGTGKTSGAKFLAHSLGLPLYLLDVGSTMQKYVGESEKTFASALAQVEALAPCVLLLDEIEKAFGADDDSGVSRRVLGMLLWWLQESPSRVFTIMTTNKVAGIPPELIRPGRVDAHVYFRPLSRESGVAFGEYVRQSLTNVCAVAQTAVESAVTELYIDADRASQAEITSTVIGCIKTQMATKLKE